MSVSFSIKKSVASRLIHMNIDQQGMLINPHRKQLRSEQSRNKLARRNGQSGVNSQMRFGVNT
jgi:hypothetical protein